MSKKHEDYLQNVLNVWGEFCKAHRLFAEALAVVLAELQDLKYGENEEKEKADNED